MVKKEPIGISINQWQQQCSGTLDIAGGWSGSTQYIWCGCS